ncbi:ABC transporter ATP-binding protein [Bacillus sp. V2I10]|uniref:ABC transporter ATP-binding protein n=1 Tax=Bacillus sp. V2I10 TaxID=3042276 RepID=UPI00277FEEFD|nr:ABC transporter ATP-binding protein [Bacillus sp. V2I10]MDQ0859933.1 ABC-type cobalamin/Fe3+-siderophores transport system ATPase subunit [Bacillus sp. V2I10]
MKDEKISIDQLMVSLSGKVILEDITSHIKEGKITVLLGVNGSGKSTLLKAISNLIPSKSGHVYLDGKAISTMPTRMVAKKMAMLPQTHDANLNMTVYELLEQGRFPHVGALKMLRKQDHMAIEHALKLTNLFLFKDRPMDELSGGERQRAWLSLALAQSTDVLLLDEPTTFLDVHHQIVLLDLIRQLNRDEGKTIIMVLHDINHALKYADDVLIIKDKQIYDKGDPKVVLNERTLQEVYGIKASLFEDRVSKEWVCVPYGITDH